MRFSIPLLIGRLRNRAFLGPALTLAAAVFLAAGAGILVRYVPGASSVLTGLNRATAAVESVTEPADEQALPVPVLQSAVRGDESDNPPPKKHAPAELPDILGQLRLMPGETLPQVIQDIYGSVDPGIIRMVAEANPGLGLPDQAAPGIIVRFPADKSLARTVPVGTSWIGLSASGRLERAYAQLRQYRYFDLDCRILVSWSESDGLIFLVTLATPVSTEAEVRKALASLPLSLQAEARPWDSARAGFMILGSL